MISCTCWRLIVIHSLTTIAQRSRLKSDQWNPSLPWSSTTVEHPVSFSHSVSYDGPTIILITMHANNKRRSQPFSKKSPPRPNSLSFTRKLQRHSYDMNLTGPQRILKMRLNYLSPFRMSNQRSLCSQNIQRAVPTAALAAITWFSRLLPQRRPSS